jgi:hypothetical protein
VSFEIIAPETPGTGFEIIAAVDDGGGPEAAILPFEIPRVPKGTTLVALVVRNDNPLTEPAGQTGWTKVIDGLGADGLFLDAFAKMVDIEADRSEEDDPLEAIFVSLEPQELQGYLLQVDDSSVTTVIEATASAAFTADATPAAPGVNCEQPINRRVSIWSTSGAIDFTAPDGFETHVAYTSDEHEERSILVAEKVAAQSGALGTVDATASGAATGRGFTIVIRKGPPATPAELYDPVPGHLGLL